MAHEECIGLRRTIKSVFPDDWIRKTARQTGYVKRQRKIDPVAFFWTLVLGSSAGPERTVSTFRRIYEQATGVELAPSSFYERFKEPLVQFLKTAAHKALENFAVAPSDVHERLKRFQDLILVDSTVIKLHDALSGVYSGSRKNTAPAAAKLNAVLSVRGKGRSTVGLYSEDCPEPRTFSVGPWVAGRLLLFDKGYFCYTLFGKINSNAGYFLTRLKDHCNPTILSVRSALQGESAGLEGRRFKDVINDLQGETFDAEIEVQFKRLVGEKKRKRTRGHYRLIGLYDAEESKYHFYITNVPVELLAAEDVYNVYRMRWEIELVFKEMKSGYGLGHIRSKSREVVEAFLYTAVITLVVSRKIFRALGPHLGSQAIRATGSRWWRLFATHAHDLLFAVTRHSRETVAMRELVQLFMHEMVDPHLQRKSLLNQDTRPPKPKKKDPEMPLAIVASLIPGIAYGA